MQVLSELDIVVPLQLLIGMFSDGVNSLKELANQRKARASDLSGSNEARRVSRTLMEKKTSEERRVNNSYLGNASFGGKCTTFQSSGQ